MQLALLVCLLRSGVSFACGGFFCAATPVEQAGERIVFRQDGDVVTAMVQIQYAGDGEAEDFGWVVPVPEVPYFQIGSNLLFTDLELATRPMFELQSEGDGCPVVQQQSEAAAGNSSMLMDETPGSEVLIEQAVDIGPFSTQVISSENSAALALWLADNGFQLSERGAELIAPYVEENMKFVTLKLRSDRDVGNIKPIILKYRSSKPVIPIRLTAVAAVRDMGVLVWLIGNGRGVPENYLHVTPNLTRLDWYSGPVNAFASYQHLITEAMDEAGGQGFATDYAGPMGDLAGQLLSPMQLDAQLTALQSLPHAEFISAVQDSFFDPQVYQAIALSLPLSDGQNEAVYFNAEALAELYTDAELEAARSAVDEVIRREIIRPLASAYELLNDNRTITRLYTTLSADEMTLDPAFVFNPDMPDRPLERQATLYSTCVDDATEWSLRLGAGTGREGQLVLQASDVLPGAAPAEVQQDASWKQETTFARGDPEVKVQRDFGVLTIEPSSATGSGSGATMLWSLLLLPVCRSVLSHALRRRTL